MSIRPTFPPFEVSIIAPLVSSTRAAPCEPRSERGAASSQRAFPALDLHIGLRAALNPSQLEGIFFRIIEVLVCQERGSRRYLKHKAKSAYTRGPKAFNEYVLYVDMSSQMSTFPADVAIGITQSEGDSPRVCARGMNSWSHQVQSQFYIRLD